jgi:hypothetical protein
MMSISDGLAFLRHLKSNNQTLNLSDTTVLNVLKELALEAVADQVYPQSIEVTLILLYSFIAAIGFVSNAFILLVILTSKKLLSNPSSLLLANLMFADIVMSVFCIPFTLIWFIRKSWSFGAVMCKVIPFLQGLSIFLSSSTIATIAIDRVIRVTGDVIITPRSPVRDYHMVQIGIETFLIWSASAMLALPVYLGQELARVSLLEWREFGKEEFVRCVDHMVHWEKLSYATTILVSQYILPVTILVFANFKIKNHLQNSLNRLKQASGSYDAETNSQADRHHLMREMKRNEKVITTLSRLTGAFMLTWLPWTITNMYVDITEPDIGNSLSLALVFCHVVAMTSVPLNAFLYGWSNPVVRMEGSRVWALLTRSWTETSSGRGNAANPTGVIHMNSISPVRTSITLSDVPPATAVMLPDSGAQKGSQ